MSGLVKGAPATQRLRASSMASADAVLVDWAMIKAASLLAVDESRNRSRVAVHRYRNPSDGLEASTQGHDLFIKIFVDQFLPRIDTEVHGRNTRNRWVFQVSKRFQKLKQACFRLSTTGVCISTPVFRETRMRARLSESRQQAS